MVLLNIANILPWSLVNGPGKRTVIWVQGCTINCPGCFNQEFLPHKPKSLVDPEILANKLIKIANENDCAGITLTGGEPFQQAQAVNTLCSKIKESGLSIVCFTGYHYDKLQKSTDQNIQKLLGLIDILISGPYNRKNQTFNRSWNINIDKEIIYLTKKYAETLSDEENVELFLNGEDIIYTGFFEGTDSKEMRDLLLKSDIILSDQ